MPTLIPVTGFYVAGSGCTLFARVLGSLGIPITPSTINSLSYTVTNLTQGTQIVTALPLDIPTCVLPALVQNDPRWALDSATAPGPDGQWGFNFEADIPASSLPGVSLVQLLPTWAQPLPEPDTIQIDVFFNPFGSQPFRVPWVMKVWPVYG